MAAMSNYLENKLVDQLFRGQPYTFPPTLYIGLLTAAPSDTGGGTEVSGGSYGRRAVASSLVNWSGTQATGSTSASAGTSATTSNNTPIPFAAPTANWGTITSFALYDAASLGNALFYGALTTSKTVSAGDPAPSFAAGSLAIQLDN